METPTEIPIFLSTLRMELMVPPNRLIQLNLMDQWRSKQASTNHQLLSFIGELAHAADCEAWQDSCRCTSVEDLNRYLKLESDFKSD